MMKDQFANYVVQKVLETCDDQQRELILSRIKVHLNALKKYTYGKHIVARVEKLVAAGALVPPWALPPEKPWERGLLISFSGEGGGGGEEEEPSVAGWEMAYPSGKLGSSDTEGFRVPEAGKEASRIPADATEKGSTWKEGRRNRWDRCHCRLLPSLRSASDAVTCSPSGL
ncbi:hypothetical protein GW17_00043130 [Ensete ventricosum]|nr:hypothetical protein GW17_00043130 [Ensete ventricosum]